ncbi:DUF58 domain-containing protein [Propionibacteriaceae bacterium Y1685]
MVLKPSAALVRAAAVVGLSGLAAVLLRRPELLILAAPFAAWCGLALARRPERLVGKDAAPEQRLSGRRLQAEQQTALTVTAPSPELITSIHLPRPARTELHPRLGAVVGLGQAVIRLKPYRWGRHVFAIDAVAMTDTWGVWTANWDAPTLQITVAPQIQPLGGDEAIPHPIGMVGQHQSRTRGEGTTLAEIRPFIAGDRLKRVNWRVTSRTGSLHTNATLAERDTEVMIITDTLADLAAPVHGRDDVHAGSASSLDQTVAAALAVADHYLSLGDRVGIFDIGYVIGHVRPGSGGRQRTMITERLANASVDRQSRGVFRRVGRIRSGSLVIFCSPLLERDALDELLQLHHRGATVLVVDTMPSELGDLTGKPQGPRYWAEAWALRRLERSVEIDRLAELGIPVVPWRGSGSLSTVIRSLAARPATLSGRR